LHINFKHLIFVLMNDTYIKKKIKKLVPKYLMELSEDYDLFIAGGAITSICTNREVNDFDVYIKRGCDLFSLLKDICCNSTILSATSKSLFVCHSGININFIFLDVYDKAEEIFETFDYTCVMGAYDMRTEELFLHEDFLLHNSQRILMFNPKTSFPIMSAIRIKKYVDRGYKISKNEFLRVMLTCSKLNISSYEELGEQIGGLYGIDVEEVFDTDKEFDMDYVIQQICDFDFDFDKEHTYSINDKKQSEMLDIAYGKVFSLVLRDTKVITKIPITEYNAEGVVGTKYLLGLDGRPCGYPDGFDLTPYPEQTEDIIITQQLYMNNGNYRIDSLDVKIGDVISKDTSNVYSRVFRVNTLDNPCISSRIGIFKTNSNFCEKITKTEVCKSELLVLKMEMIGVLDMVDKTKTLNIFDLEEIDL
jgi:hypothetical protein